MYLAAHGFALACASTRLVVRTDAGDERRLVWLETNREKIPLGQSGWKPTVRKSLLVNLAGN
jgi:hypothetical protein